MNRGLYQVCFGFDGIKLPNASYVREDEKRAGAHDGLVSDSVLFKMLMPFPTLYPNDSSQQRFSPTLHSPGYRGGCQGHQMRGQRRGTAGGPGRVGAGSPDHHLAPKHRPGAPLNLPLHAGWGNKCCGPMFPCTPLTPRLNSLACALYPQVVAFFTDVTLISAEALDALDQVGWLVARLIDKP